MSPFPSASPPFPPPRRSFALPRPFTSPAQPLHPRLATVGLFSVSVRLFLFCLFMYFVFGFHKYEIVGISLSLTYFT